MTDRDRAFLTAVAAGRVRHIHPFSWALPLELLDYRGAERTLDKLASQGLIRVEATSPEYQRPVTVTEKGRAALEVTAVRDMVCVHCDGPLCLNDNGKFVCACGATSRSLEDGERTA